MKKAKSKPPHFYNSELIKEYTIKKHSMDLNSINKIVLWKLGRGINFGDKEESILVMINDLKNANEFKDGENCLRELLKLSGVRLPMASTILRFRNPSVFQIIDQRVHRVLYKQDDNQYEIVYKKYKNTINGKSENKINQQVELYFKYLDDLRKYCNTNGVDFKLSDRKLYEKDKAKNGKLYGY